MKCLIGALLGFSICVLVQGQQKLAFSSFSDLQNSIVADQENITVLNIWATWCKPCVAELGEFDKLHQTYQTKNVRVILANVDFHSQVDSLVPVFMDRKKILSEVIHITDEDSNDWINLMDENWAGEIPVTGIYYKGRKVWFYSGQTDYETLEDIITKYL